MSARAPRGREATLLAVERTALDIVSVHHGSAVFDAAVARAQTLLAADIAYLAVYEDATGRTCVRASIGACTPDFNALNVPFGVGVGGVVARSRAPFLTSDYIADRTLLHIDAVDRGIAAEGIRAMLGVPLIARGELTGVLFVSDRRPRTYTPAEVRNLQALGAVVTVAIENARLFESRETMLRDVQGAYEALRRKTAATESIANLHEALSAIVCRGGPIEDLADGLAEAFGVSVAIADAEGLDIAGSAAQEPDSLVRAALAESRRTGHLAVVAPVQPAGDTPSHAETERLALALAVGGQDLGSLVVTSTRPMLGTARRSIERAGHVAALLLLRRERDHVADLRHREACFARALRSDDGPPCGPGTALAFDPSSHGADRLSRTLVRSGAIGEAALGAFGDAVVVLLEGAASGAAATEAVAAAVAARLGRAPTVAWATLASGPGAAFAAADEAVRWLRTGLALGLSGEVVSRERLGANALLLKGNSACELAAFVDVSLGPVARYDAARSTDLMATLRAYFATGQNLRETADSLGVHMKTVVQRLDRIGQLLGSDWRSPQRLFEFQLAIRIGELARLLP